MSEAIDKKYLAGLKFRTSKKVKGVEGEVVHQAVERDLRPEDVISFAHKGKEVVIVTADGKKYRVDTGKTIYSGDPRPNAAQSIELVKAAKSLDELTELAKGEERKTVLEAIAARKEELAA